jgi:hypothetical protein
MSDAIVPSKRVYPFLRLARTDDNIFFTALSLRIIYDFQLNDHSIDVKDIEKVFDQFHELINGAKLYQFWKRKPNAYFPNGRLLHRHDMFKPPPDADTTALIYYVAPHSQLEIDQFFDALRRFANTSTKTNLNAKSIYSTKKVFSTWFGSGKMPIEFDLVVLINTFYVLERYGYPMDDYYRDSIYFVKHEMESMSYIKAPFDTSPWYSNPCIIFYQLSRFIYFHPQHELAQLVPTLKEHYEMICTKAEGAHDLLLINSAMMFLNVGVHPRPSLDSLSAESDKYSFFIASMLALLPGKIFWWLARFKIFHWKFVCPTYNELLLAENEAIRTIRSRN